MKLWRKLVLPLVTLLVMGLLVGPLASPAAALTRVSVCVVAGTVDLSRATGVLPPFVTTATPGTYNFVGVVVVCVGVRTSTALSPPLPPVALGNLGVATGVASNGTVNTLAGAQPPGTGDFAGTYQATFTFPLLLLLGLVPLVLTGTLGSCAAGSRVGGPHLNLGGGPVSSLPWSLTVGLLILGFIECNLDSSPQQVGGAIALVAVPDPTGGIVTLGAGLGDCAFPVLALLGNLTGPLGQPGPPQVLDLNLLLALLLLVGPVLGFCDIIVGGVAVID